MMDINLAIFRLGLTEAVTILNGIVLGEVFYRILAEFYFDRVNRRRQRKVSRRNTDDDITQRRRTRFQRFLRNQFDKQFAIVAVVLAVAYVSVVGLYLDKVLMNKMNKDTILTQQVMSRDSDTNSQILIN